MTTVANKVPTQGVYINVPKIDWPLLRELIRKFGWKAETREQMLDRFGVRNILSVNVKS